MKTKKGEKIAKQDCFFNILIILYWIKVRLLLYLESCPLLTFTESVIPRPTDVTINALFHVKANSFSANKNSSILLKNKPPSNSTIGIQTTRFSPEIDRRLVRNIK